MANGARFYWLKLKRDFFKRHDIRIIESMPNGKEYILFYLKLLCESVDHDGHLRFNDQIPYSPDMLATITNTNVDVVKSAIDIFTQLGMMDIFDDGTYFMNEVERMIGSASNTDGANRVRRYREKQKMLMVDNNVTSCNADVTSDVTEHNESKSKSKSKSKNNIYISSKDLVEEFTRLWNLYPKYRKQGKKKAFDSYKSARKNGTTFEEVKQGILAYQRYINAERIETKFIKQASTFFSQQAWRDEWTSKKSAALNDDDELDGIL